MQRILRAVLVALLWLLVVAYVFYAATLTRRARGRQTVGAIRIEVLDSTSRGSLISRREVSERLRRGGLDVLAQPIDSVSLHAIEQTLRRNGFVDRVRAYTREEGLLCIELSERRPILRLRAGGMDSYATEEGYIFFTPPRSALYVPVLTGDYRPPVAVNFEGSLREEVDRRLAVLDSTIVALEREKYPHYRAERENDRRLDSVRRYRIKRRGFLINRETEEEFEVRVEQTRAEKAAARRHLRYVGRQIQARIDKLDEQQESLRREQKKLEKYYEDFMKLLTFVEHIEQDAFWRSELVEICATRTSGGALELSFIPRSGRFVIRFGRLEEVAYKFEKLDRFYRKGLPVMGWDRYREVDVRFADRVVCR